MGWPVATTDDIAGGAATKFGGGGVKVGCLFNSAWLGGIDTRPDGWPAVLPAGSSPVSDGHKELDANEHPERKIAAPRTATVDLRKFTLPDRRTQKAI
ncbi:MAG: hypothetical protein OSB82_09575 [Alphaproteobacteria bacterium]|nr:hypothetical protein [Alphaproteobacteria bacterium]